MLEKLLAEAKDGYVPIGIVRVRADILEYYRGRLGAIQDDPKVIGRSVLLFENKTLTCYNVQQLGVEAGKEYEVLYDKRDFSIWKILEVKPEEKKEGEISI
jgi:hypothetical protein